MLAKLYDMGVLNSMAKLSDVENKLTVAAFCRRRLAVVMCAARMAETVSAVSSPFFFSSGIQFFFFFSSYCNFDFRRLWFMFFEWVMNRKGLKFRVGCRLSSSSNKVMSESDPILSQTRLF